VITRQTKVQLLVFFLVAVFGLSYAGSRYANIHLPGHDKGYLVQAEFSDSGGIFKGAEVTNRGVAVGKVEKLTLTDNGVRLSLRLRPGTVVHTPTTALVANRSAVGEQYVELEPQTNDGPGLKQGSTIPREQTSIPIPPTQLIVNLDNLVNSVDTKDVTTVLSELGKAFEGSGTDLQRLIDASDKLTTAATQNLPQTLKLIQDSKPVLDTQRAVAGNFQSYNASLASLTAQLRASDPDFRTLFTNGAASAKVTQSLLEANRTALPLLLDNLISTAQVQKVRIPALRQILVTYPNVVAGGFTVTPGDGTAHFGAAMTNTPAPCTSGYETTKVRPPEDVSPHQSNVTAYCSAPVSSGQDIRGGANAPRPNGLKAYPNDGGSSAQQALFDSITGQDGYTGESIGFADYDPASGRAISQSGQQFTIGSNTGLTSMSAASSWEWLFLDPLRAS
jgi:phospholipid/cholesterol/gamma-HCH transport system substrate-binding protein